ncbi:type IV conjugative transfer system protein TraL [Cysteiniphilum sp. 6C5]|uniref:type IV conjugative transfer system protein TraL n=1 Tax=unclassified Cysteiniphilum TaxID=2610889 RepID=UPI003F82E94E
MANQEEDQDFTRVCKYLNKPRLTMGCTTDEIAPAFVVMATGVITSHLSLCFLIGMSWIFGVKTLKRYRSPQFLAVAMYWFLGQPISKMVFKKTIDSAQRFWLR